MMKKSADDEIPRMSEEELLKLYEIIRKEFQEDWCKSIFGFSDKIMARMEGKNPNDKGIMTAELMINLLMSSAATAIASFQIKEVRAQIEENAIQRFKYMVGAISECDEDCA